MQRLLGLGIGTRVGLVLLATGLLPEPPLAQARRLDEAALAAGADEFLSMRETLDRLADRLRAAANRTRAS